MSNNTDKLAAWIEDNAEKINEESPNGWSASRVRRLIYHLRSEGSWKLNQCTPGSLVQCVLLAAHLDLDIQRDEAYLVPYRQKRQREDGSWEKWYEAELMPGYKGLVKLAQRAPGIEDVHARVVREDGLFEFEQTLDGIRLVHQPNGFSDEPIVGAYVIIEKEDPEAMNRVERMSKQQIQEVRKKAAEDSGAWNDFYPEMSKKVVTRRALKWVDLDPEAQDFIHKADVIEYDFENDRRLSNQNSGGGLNDIIEGRKSREAIPEKSDPMDELYNQIANFANETRAAELVEKMSPTEAKTRLQKLQNADEDERADLVKEWSNEDQEVVV